MLSYSQLLYFCLNYSLFYFVIAVAWSSIIMRKRSRINIEDGPAEQNDDDAMYTQSSDPHAHLPWVDIFRSNGTCPACHVGLHWGIFL